MAPKHSRLTIKPDFLRWVYSMDYPILYLDFIHNRKKLTS